MSKYEVEVSREKFYEEVWNELPHRVSMKYGLAEIGISKVCNENNIPKPASSYWKKMNAGEKVWKQDLPEVKDPQPVKFRSKHERIGEEDPELLDLACSKIEFEHDPANKIIAPKELIDLHPVTIRTQKELKRSSKSYLGSKSTKNYPKIDVSDEAQYRALLVVDTLAKALEQRGYDASLPRFFDQEMKICITEDYDSKLKSGVKEKIKTDPYRDGYRIDDHERTLSGRLILSLEFNGYCGDGLQRNWKDRKKDKIEVLLNEFICGMIRQAAVLREWRLGHDRWHREYEERARRQEEAARQQAMRQAKREKLINDVGQWHQAALIRQFATAVEQQQVIIDPDMSIEDWFQWANAEADRIDPLSPNLKIK